jgi:DNA-directed RNA polymerase specialized sigma24 family protein
MTLSETQFRAVAKLISLRTGPAQDAAYEVLVKGVAPGQAANVAGCSPQSAANTIKRIKRAMLLAKDAAAP